jgi:hypothetical protein
VSTIQIVWEGEHPGEPNFRTAKRGEKGMEDWRERISVDPNVCHGAPCIKGTRIMVWVILIGSEGQNRENPLASGSGISQSLNSK